MEALFLKLVNMSVTASWLVLAIIAVRLVFKKAPKWILCLLWALVAIRLVCPFSMESSLSLVPDAEPLSQETIHTTQLPRQAHGDILDSEGNVLVSRVPAARGEILDSEGNVMAERPLVAPDAEAEIHWTGILTKIWMTGVIIMLFYSIVSYQLLKRKVATAIPLKRGIKQSEYVDSPFVLGIVRPVIYLPFDMAGEDMVYVIAHEKAHIRRRDHWWKPLGFLLLSIYWFNPVLWAAYILLCRDIEAACDEKVIRDMEKEERRAYSRALLHCSIHRRRIAACPLAFGEVGVKQRVKGVMDYKKPAFWVILVCLALLAVISVCFLTDPQNALPITMEADYVNRTRADLKFRFEDLPEDGYQISESYRLETQVDGAWQELPKESETQASEMVVVVTADNAPYDAWSLPNWEDVYGQLPDGVYRITKEITIHADSEEPETYPVSVEFTIGGSADEYVTFTLEDITPTGAKLYEQEKLEDEFQLIYNGDGDIWLEAMQDGQWQYLEPTQYIEPILRKDKYYVHQHIYPSDYIQLDWSTLYGALPDGSYRLVREVTNVSEEDLRLCTAYVEFTIGPEETPVTISLENVRPYGARILFHQNKDLIDGKLLCDREFFLEQQIDGQWVRMKEGIIPLDVEDDPYDIALLAYQDVSWSSAYGDLPVGVYRLGKVIPITSGNDPEYKTIYAEFTIDKVYTWFDLYSNDADERRPSDSMLDIGVEGTGILSYHPELNTIYLIDSEDREPLITCDVIIRNVFLTDLTGDGVPEVCATVQNESSMAVQVYEAVEKKLYTLPDCETSHDVLTKKADRLIVERKQDNTAAYYQLSLETGKGLVLTDPDSEVQALTQKIVCVDVWPRKRTCLSSGEPLTKAITLLRDLRNTVTPATVEELEEAVNNAMYITLLTVNYELGEKNLSFSEDFDLIWEEGSKEAFRIPDPEPIRQFVASVTDGVRNKETAGEPFATVDTPWEWCANLTTNAVSTAEAFACLNVTSYGNTTSVSSTNGILPMDSLQRLIPILNRIPADAISTEGNIISDYNRFQRGDQIEGSCSVSLIDGVNQMAVAIRSYKGAVEMILTTDLDAARSNNHQNLCTPATIWTIRDPSLRAFLDDVRENPPVINYSVGAEYDWQGPIKFESEDFSMELYLIKDWEYANVLFHDHSGIRCRPKDAEEGWIYFSFWPHGYTTEEEDLHYEERIWNSFPSKTAYPTGVISEDGYVTQDTPWSFEIVNTDIGDFAIINDGADDWFAEYADQIYDTLSLLSFATE